LKRSPLPKIIFTIGVFVNLTFIISIFSHLRIKSLYPFELVHELPGEEARNNLYLPEFNKELEFPIHLQDMDRKNAVHLWDKFFFDSTHWEVGHDLFCQFRGVYSMRKGKNIYYNLLRWGVIEDEKELPYRGLAYSFPPIGAYTIYNFFALFKIFNAYALWVSMQEISLYLSVFLTRKIAAIYNMEKNLVSSFWLFFSPVYVDMYMGQAGIIISFLVMLCIYGVCFEKKGWLYFGFTTSLHYKLTTIFFTPVLLRMKRYWLLAINLGALLLTFYLAYLDHPSNFRKFLYQLGGWEVAPHRGDFAIKELLYWVTDKEVADVISWIIRYSTLFIVTYISLKGKHFDPPLLFAFWSSAYFMVNLRIWEHHFAMILPALVFGYIVTRSRFILIMFVLLALPTPYILFNSSPWTQFKHIIHHSFLTIPAASVFIYLLIYHLKKGFVPPFPLINK